MSCACKSRKSIFFFRKYGAIIDFTAFTYEESAMVQNNEAGVYQMKTEKGDKITVLWTDMEKGWIVKVTGYNISKEDMLRISESVEIR